MSLTVILALSWVAFVILVIAALNGWLYNLYYTTKVIIGALLDVARQAWIDVSKIWQSRKQKEIELDEYERKLS